MKKLIIIGAGGHGKVVADAANRLHVFLDDDRDQYSVAGALSDLPTIKRAGDQIIVAVGDNKKRLEILKDQQDVATVVHQNATISESATLGEGTVIFANAAVNSDAKIGRGCIVNTGATIDHDCVLEDGVHISPGAHVGGGVSIGRCSWIGIGASVIHGVTIGHDVIIGAGAAVVCDIPNSVTVVGVPARVLVI